MPQQPPCSTTAMLKRQDLSPCGDTATELRATRCWNRHKTVLDSAEGGGLSAAARQAITNADRVELGTLLEELPAYLASRGQLLTSGIVKIT